VNNFLNLSHGVCPLYMELETGTRLDVIMEFMEKSGFAQKNERVIIIEGKSADNMKCSDSLRIITVR
jgi:pyruvate kinase